MSRTADVFVKSPLNYIGGKYKLLPQLVPLFPDNINCFVDLFAGGGNVGVNVSAGKIILNDNLTYLVDLYSILKKLSQQDVLNHIYGRISEFDLSLTNVSGYNELRLLYNKYKNPLDLFVLVAYSFNHQIRFNNSHEFNNPFGKNRSAYNSCMEKNLLAFIDRLHKIDIEFSDKDFAVFDVSGLGTSDFVYADPPYLITTGTYNDGKRGFKGWNESEELKLLNLLDNLTRKGVRFALSNVLMHKGRVNEILMNWLMLHSDYCVTEIDMDYSNSNYHLKIRDKTATREVLITNYIPECRNIANEALLSTKESEYEVYRKQRKFA